MLKNNQQSLISRHPDGEEREKRQLAIGPRSSIGQYTGTTSPPPFPPQKAKA